MKLGIIIYSNDPETVWNALRLSNFSQAMSEQVEVFLIGKGVEVESLDTDKFNISEQVQTLVGDGGKLYACGTCLELRQMKISDTYAVSTLKELYEIIENSDKVVSF
ncbi:DsrE family protein [Chloroflexota bacterium]